MAVSRKAMTEGIRTSLFPGTFNIYNPSVSRLRETREPAPFTQESLWVLPHQCVPPKAVIFCRDLTIPQSAALPAPFAQGSRFWKKVGGRRPPTLL